MTYSVLICSGSVTLTDQGAPLCSEGWATALYVAPFDPAAIDPATIAAVFGAGFSLVIGVWAAAFGLSQLVKMIKG